MEVCMIEQRLKHAAAMVVCGTFLFACVLTVAAQTAEHNENPFLVRFYESLNDLGTNGISNHDCIVVLPDGHFHLERRRQQLPKASATLKVYESVLDTGQMRQLEAILNDGSIKKLPPFVQPTTPMDVAIFGVVNTKIPRGAALQSVGYLTWRGGAPGASPNSAPDEIKRTWRESETALKPLVAWVHSIVGQELEPSASKSTLCEAARR
jgi:hypothetical protein